jgi:FdhD protein
MTSGPAFLPRPQAPGDGASTGRASSRRPATPVQVLALSGGSWRRRPDQVVTEEPLEIRAGGPGQEPLPLAVTMRTPGHDFELAAGFLLSEGLIGAGGGEASSPPALPQVRAVRYCDLPPGQVQQYNIVSVTLTAPLDEVSAERRRTASTASCGLCGTATLADLERRCQPVAEGPVLPAPLLLGLPEALRRSQRLFERTGGLHAAGLFRADGTLVSLREDVGRHNALDKLIGQAVLDHHLPLTSNVVALSGRIGYELVQKSALAGIPVIVAVGAPSSLAVATARHLGITTVGFVRPGRANIYTHPERVATRPGRPEA